MYIAGREGVPPNPAAWGLQKHLMRSLTERWTKPDEGIWEVRGPRRQFTHSKVMTWVAVDRAILSVEQLGLVGPVERWKALREQIRAEVLEKGYDPAGNTFTWYYGAKTPDASLLLLPVVGFLPASDSRITGTLEAIQERLLVDGFLQRYELEESPPVDGLPAGEGAFLPCTFWLADNLVLQGRRREARAIFARLLAVRNDLGLLAEEYDVKNKRLLGNFPQALSHVSLINTALNLTRGPARLFEPPPAGSRHSGRRKPAG